MNFLARYVENAFFYSDRLRYWRPEHYGLKGTEFKCTASSGETISGRLLYAGGGFEDRPAGTVVYCHSGRMNQEFNLPQAAFLAEGGMNVVLFDYEGCGYSGGQASLDRLGEDTAAVIDWLDESPWKAERIVLFGQFIGCDAALQYYSAHPKRVAGLALESCYATRRGWVKDKWGPLVGDILARFLHSQTVEPAQVLRNSHVPTVVICPGRDFVVHSRERKALLAAIPPHAQVWKAEGLRFLGVFGGQKNIWQESLVQFFREKCFGVKEGKKKGSRNKTGR
ncbi:MAG: alpha/beta hydrolase [Mesosutterella sp.]|nr:alpha/beta hydrolase [Mesosutterella sp.]